MTYVKTIRINGGATMLYVAQSWTLDKEAGPLACRTAPQARIYGYKVILRGTSYAATAPIVSIGKA